MSEYNRQSSPVQSSPVRDSIPKALIVTLITPDGNYGNSLQHYALNETLKSLGYDVESLDCPRTGHRIADFVIKNLKRAVKLVLAVLGVKKYRQKLSAKLNGIGRAILSQQSERKSTFQAFYNEYIGGIIHSTYREVLNSKSRWNKYQRIITGSDQVWSIGNVKTFEALRYYYLEFAEPGQRVAYAPSFGVSKLKFSERHVHRKCLQGFSKLSCREEEGSEIIRQLTGKYAEVVLDPTFLLTAQDWRKIARKPEYSVPEHYALCYFWDNENEEYLKAVHEISRGLEIVFALNHEGKTYGETGPLEFLWLVDHADYVFTESFHGTAFAINFGKRFLSFGEGSIRFSRIRTLLANLGLMDRVYYPHKTFSGSDIDYNAVNNKLNTLRESSMRYLKECLQ